MCAPRTTRKRLLRRSKHNVSWWRDDGLMLQRKQRRQDAPMDSTTRCCDYLSSAPRPLPTSCPRKLPGSGPDPSLEVVKNNCTGCHSADYISTRPQGPKYKKDFWPAEVTKMIKVYGAPIEEADMGKIVDYLAATY
jgi:hypothetical protein